MAPTPGIVNRKSRNYIRMSYSSGGERPKAKELPFVIGVIADLSGMPDHSSVPLQERHFLAIDAANFDAVMERIEPSLTLKVSNALSDDDTLLRVDLRFRRLADFSPGGIVRQVSPLAKLLELRTQLHGLLRTVESDKDFGKAVEAAFTDPDRFERLKQEVADPQPPRDVTTASPFPDDEGSWSMLGHPHAATHSVLDEIVDSGRSITTPEAHVRTRDAVHALVLEYTAEGRPATIPTPADMRQRICLLDELISSQLRKIMHSPAFQKLEATWRGMRHLVRVTRKTPSVKVRVLNASKKELHEDFRRKNELKKSALAQRILVEEFETLGGEPYGLVIADYEFGPEPEELELLEEFARVAASAYVPFVAAPRPALVGIQHFGEPPAPGWSDLRSRPEFARWCSFQAWPRSRFIGLVLPHVLLRSPYGKSSRREQEFDFEEGCYFEERSRYLWGSAAWVLAARLANDFERYGWFGGPRDSGDTGMVKGLPAHSNWTGTEVLAVGPVEACIDEERTTALTAAGLIALRQANGTLEAQFSGTWSCHVPVASEEADSADSDDRPVEIETLMSACRVAHYVRAITKEHRDTFRSRASCEQWIQRWIADYVVPAYMKDSLQSERFPLQAAEVSIVDSERDDGGCLVRLALLLQGQTAPVELEIPIDLPRATSPAMYVEPAAVSAIVTDAAETPSGRDQFLHRLFLAEQYIRAGRIEPATAILEGLDEQVERFHLLEWESPKLIGTVWAMLRQCYRAVPPTEDTARRSAELLRRCCTVDPAGLLE